MFAEMTLTNRMTVSLVVILAMWSSAAFAEQSDRIEIRIWDQTTVVTPEICLAQIATITGQPKDVAALKPFILVSSLSNDQTLTLRAWEIAGRLSEAGFDTNRIDVRGSAKCVVNYVTEKRDPMAQDTAETGSTTTRPAEGRFGPASLETKIREVIKSNLTDKGLPPTSTVDVRFNDTIRELLALTEPPYHFEIEPQQRTTNWIGLVALKVKIYRNSDLLQTIPVLAQVQVKTEVAIAVRTINSKAKMSNQDVEMSLREITNLDGKFVTCIDDISDQQAKRMIPLGTMITGDMLEGVPLVKRGQLVSVLYNRSGLEIKLVGKAMQNGYRDEVVQVRNERSKEIFRAKVIGAGQVLVENSLPAESLKDTSLADGSKH
jgi:flagella basal body P-ring formation protein FlgA